MNLAQLKARIDWKRCKPLIQWGLAVICLAYIFDYLFEHRQEAALALRFNPVALLSMFALMATFFFLQSYRTLVLIRKCSHRAIGYWVWFRLFITGMAYNQILPQLGNVYRGVVLKRHHDVAYTSYISAYASLAWIDTWQNLLIATAVFLFTGTDLKLAGMNASALMLATALAVIGVPILLLLISKALEDRLERTLWLHGKLSEVLSISLSSLRDPVFTFRITLSGLALFALMSALFYAGFKMVGAHLSLAETALFYTLFKVSTHVFITPGNLGIRELAYGLLSQQIQVNMANGIVVCVLLRILGYLVLLILMAASRLLHKV